MDKSAVLDAGGFTAIWLAATRARLRFVPAAELLRGRLADTVTRTAAWLVRAAGATAVPDRLQGMRVVLPGAQQGLAEASARAGSR